MRDILSAVRLAGLAAALVHAPASADTTERSRWHPATEQVSSAHQQICALTDGVARDPRAAILVEKARSWTKERRDAFMRLLAAADTFGRAVAADEIDHSGDDPCQAQAAELAERRVFLTLLERAVARETFSAPLLTFAEADGALNAAYREVMAVRDPRDLAWGSVEKHGIRRAERAWLSYRDAFVAFAATLEEPGLAERVKIDLTARRATRLEAFLAD